MRLFFFIVSLFCFAKQGNSQWIVIEPESPPLLTPGPLAKPNHSEYSPIWSDGNDALYLFNDEHMWRYEINTQRWLWQPEVIAPARRKSAYWGIQNKIYLYGGISVKTGSTLGGMWYYDPNGRNFTHVMDSKTCSGSAFWKHAATNKLYMWGGRCNNVTVSSLRSFDINSKQWEEDIPTHDGGNGMPLPAQDIAATLGKGDIVYLYTNDKLWKLDIPTFTWTQATVGNNGSPPGPQRTGHSMWTTSDGVIMLYGGTAGSKIYVDTWSYEDNHWNLLDIGNGPPNQGFSTCTDSSGNLYLYGGNDLWKYGKITVKTIFQLIEWKLDSATLAATVAAIMSSLVFFGIILMSLGLCIRRCIKKRKQKKMGALRDGGDYDL